eukprot:gene24592-biopygen14957
MLELLVTSFNPTHQTPFPPTGRQEGGSPRQSLKSWTNLRSHPPPPCARAARRVGADARREARIRARGCAPENPGNSRTPPPPPPSTGLRRPKTEARGRIPIGECAIRELHAPALTWGGRASALTWGGRVPALAWGCRAPALTWGRRAPALPTPPPA